MGFSLFNRKKDESIASDLPPAADTPRTNARSPELKKKEDTKTVSRPVQNGMQEKTVKNNPSSLKDNGVKTSAVIEKNPEERAEKISISVVGKPLIFEDTGLPVGNIVDEKRTQDKRTVLSYEVEKDGKTFEIPSAAVKITAAGIYFVPLWYVETMEFIRELEYQATVMPEFVRLLSDTELDYDRLLLVIEESDPRLKELIEESAKLKETISKKLSSLEVEKLRLKKEINALKNSELLSGTPSKNRMQG